MGCDGWKAPHMEVSGCCCGVEAMLMLACAGLESLDPGSPEETTGLPSSWLLGVEWPLYVFCILGDAAYTKIAA